MAIKKSPVPPRGGKVPKDVVFAQPVDTKPLMGEYVPIAGWFGDKQATFYNPDDLVQRKGIEIYERMGIDDQIAAALRIKILSRLASGYDVEAASSKPEHTEHRDFVADVFDRLPAGMDSKLTQWMSAFKYGYATAEKVYEIRHGGRWDGKLVYKDVKAKSPFVFEFVIDPYGNIMPDGVQLNGRAGQAGTRLPRSKFVHWAYNAEFGNPYGLSDLRPCYRSYFSKDFIIKLYNLHIEKFASPTPMGFLPENLTDDERDAVKATLDHLQNATAATFPQDVEVKYMESRLGGAIAFKFGDAIDMHNRFIGRAILVPDMLGYSGGVQGGSFALGRKQIDVYFMVLSAIGRDLEETVIGEQMIRELIDMNYGPQDAYPRFRFREVEADLAVRATVVKILVEAGAVDPHEDWVRGYLDLPESALPPPQADVFTALERIRTDHGVVLKSLICPACLTIVRADMVVDKHCSVAYHTECMDYFGECTKESHSSDLVRVGVRSPRESVVQRAWTPRKSVKPHEPQHHPAVIPAPPAPSPDWSQFTQTMREVARALETGKRDQPAQAFAADPELEAPAIKRPLTPAEQHTPFERIRVSTDQLVESTVKWLTAPIMAIRDKLIAQVQTRALVAKQKTSALPDLDLAASGLAVFRRVLSGFALINAGNGAVSAAEEIAAKLGQMDHASSDAEMVSEYLTPQAAAAAFNGTRVGSAIGAIRIDLSGFLQDFFLTRAELLVSGERDWILGQARQILAKAILQGDPRLAEERIAALFDQWLPRGTGKAPRLYTMLYTLAGEALNQGRKSVYESDLVRPHIVAYQWSSILDARTTDYCRRMDRKVFRPEQMASQFPPAHYRCRSVVVALVDGEPFKLSGGDPMAPAAGMSRPIGFTDQEGETMSVLYDLSSAAGSIASRAYSLRAQLFAGFPTIAGESEVYPSWVDTDPPWHVTVAYGTGMDPQAAEAAAERVRADLPRDPFELVAGPVSMMTNHDGHAVLFLAVDCPQLCGFAEAVRADMQAHGAEFAHAQYKPHITLGYIPGPLTDEQMRTILDWPAGDRITMTVYPADCMITRKTTQGWVALAD